MCWKFGNILAWVSVSAKTYNGRSRTTSFIDVLRPLNPDWYYIEYWYPNKSLSSISKWWRVLAILKLKLYVISIYLPILQVLDDGLYKPVKFKKFKRMLRPYFNQVYTHLLFNFNNLIRIGNHELYMKSYIKWYTHENIRFTMTCTVKYVRYPQCADGIR